MQYNCTIDMLSVVQSISDIAAIKIAILLCNNLELKREVLCASGTEYEARENEDNEKNKEQWDEIIEQKAGILMKNLIISDKLQNKVMGNVLLVGLRMLSWTMYHERACDLSRDYCVNFLSSSFFTQLGIIDSKKTVEKLMKDQSLTVIQKYKLACIYCFKERIPALYREMSKKDKKRFYHSEYPSSVKQLEIVKFWTYYLMGDIDMLKGDTILEQYRLETAIESGSVTAVKYCIKKTNVKQKTIVFIYSAVKSIKNKINSKRDLDLFGRKGGYYSRIWIPSDYYIDILYSVLSEMNENQQIIVLKRDIEGVAYEGFDSERRRHSRILEYFLDWPYQNYFMSVLKMAWSFLPKRSFADLLLKICDKIESKKGSLKYGEERSYDYRKLLRRLWKKSPNDLKMYVLDEKEISLKYCDGKKILREGAELLFKLYTLKSFSSYDRETIKMILDCADDQQREDIIHCQEGKNICFQLIEKERWEILHEFLLDCFPTKEEEERFKREIAFFTKGIYMNFVKDKKWDAVSSFIKWSTLPKDETDRFKKEIISSAETRSYLSDLLHEEKWEMMDEFLSHYLETQEQVDEFKREFSNERQAMYAYVNFVKKSQWDAAKSYLKWTTLCEDEIIEFKKKALFLWEINDFICDLIMKEEWKKIDDIFSQIFHLSQETVDEMKRKFLSNKGRAIYEKFVIFQKWDAVEYFFKWISLPEEDIIKFRKETISSYAIKEQFCYMIRKEKWESLDEFVLKCFPSQDLTEEFKRQFCNPKYILDTCCDFLQSNLYSDNSSTRRNVHENQISELITSNQKESDSYTDFVNGFIMWCSFPSVDKVHEFKKTLFSSERLISIYEEFILSDAYDVEFLNKFLKQNLTFEEIRELKRDIAYEKRWSILEKMKSGIEGYFFDTEMDEKEFYDEYDPIKKFMEVEKILTWYFASEEEINNFKRKCLIENTEGACFSESLLELHFTIMSTNRWVEAELFFSWLGLSSEEVKELKKQTLFSPTVLEKVLEGLPEKLLQSEYGEREEMELYLRWCLPDAETLIQFKNELDELSCDYRETYTFCTFCELIEGLLNDLRENGEKSKRKAETPMEDMPNKRNCIAKDPEDGK